MSDSETEQQKSRATQQSAEMQQLAAELERIREKMDKLSHGISGDGSGVNNVSRDNTFLHGAPRTQGSSAPSSSFAVRELTTVPKHFQDNFPFRDRKGFFEHKKAMRRFLEAIQHDMSPHVFDLVVNNALTLAAIAGKAPDHIKNEMDQLYESGVRGMRMMDELVTRCEQEATTTALDLRKKVKGLQRGNRTLRDALNELSSLLNLLKMYEKQGGVVDALTLTEKLDELMTNEEKSHYKTRVYASAIDAEDIRAMNIKLQTDFAFKLKHVQSIAEVFAFSSSVPDGRQFANSALHKKVPHGAHAPTKSGDGKCGACGYNKHDPGKTCPAIDGTCRSCGQSGHFEKRCPKLLRQQQQQKSDEGDGKKNRRGKKGNAAFTALQQEQLHPYDEALAEFGFSAVSKEEYAALAATCPNNEVLVWDTCSSATAVPLEFVKFSVGRLPGSAKMMTAAKGSCMQLDDMHMLALPVRDLKGEYHVVHEPAYVAKDVAVPMLRGIGKGGKQERTVKVDKKGYPIAVSMMTKDGKKIDVALSFKNHLMYVPVSLGKVAHTSPTLIKLQQPSASTSTLKSRVPMHDNSRSGVSSRQPVQLKQGVQDSSKSSVVVSGRQEDTSGPAGPSPATSRGPSGMHAVRPAVSHDPQQLQSVGPSAPMALKQGVSDSSQQKMARNSSVHDDNRDTSSPAPPSSCGPEVPQAVRPTAVPKSSHVLVQDPSGAFFPAQVIETASNNLKHSEQRVDATTKQLVPVSLGTAKPSDVVHVLNMPVSQSVPADVLDELGVSGSSPPSSGGEQLSVPTGSSSSSGDDSSSNHAPPEVQIFDDFDDVESAISVDVVPDEQKAVLAVEFSRDGPRKATALDENQAKNHLQMIGKDADCSQGVKQAALSLTEEEMNRILLKAKARMVADGSHDPPDLQEIATYSGTCDVAQERVVTIFGAGKGWIMGMSDVLTAFLRAGASKDQPLVIRMNDDLPPSADKLGCFPSALYKQLKAFYGTTEAARLFQQLLHTEMKSGGWQEIAMFDDKSAAPVAVCPAQVDDLKCMPEQPGWLMTKGIGSKLGIDECSEVKSGQPGTFVGHDTNFEKPDVVSIGKKVYAAATKTDLDAKAARHSIQPHEFKLNMEALDMAPRDPAITQQQMKLIGELGWLANADPNLALCFSQLSRMNTRSTPAALELTKRVCEYAKRIHEPVKLVSNVKDPVLLECCDANYDTNTAECHLGYLIQLIDQKDLTIGKGVVLAPTSNVIAWRSMRTGRAVGSSTVVEFLALRELSVQ